MSEVEEKAKAQGWTPQEDFKGDPEKWRSAEDFLKVGEKVAAVQSERNNKLLEELNGLKGTVKDLTDAQKEFHKEQFKVIHEAKIEGYNKAKKELAKKQEEAVEEGDVAKFKQLKAEEEKLEKPEVETNPAAQPKVTPEFQTWVDKNPWYLNDPELQVMADSVGKAIEVNHTGTPAQFYKKVADKVKKAYPEKFETAKAPNLDDGPAGKTPTKKGKTFDDLPQEAKEACKRQVAGKMITKENYVKFYFEQE